MTAIGDDLTLKSLESQNSISLMSNDCLVENLVSNMGDVFTVILD